MFVDTAKVFVRAGKGGDGVVSFRHEIYVDKGGPDGGDGGRGGDVIFLVDEGLNTLVDFRYQPELTAQNGVNGAKQKMRGKSGSNREVKVPIGTLVKRDGAIIADLSTPDARAVVARGGDGGFGNAHFKSSTRQAPKIAELGEPGDEFEAELELKLLADVGLIGFPNAGKSTFLSVVSNARPEIADYAFTTLRPNLGVADIDEDSILIADIPGLIEGASQGKGLGDQFLRHVERTAVLLHMIDIYTDDIAAAYTTIRHELEQYSPELAQRKEVIALTKTDGVDEELIAMQREQLMSVCPADTALFAISSTSHTNITRLLRCLRDTVAAVREQQAQRVAESEDAATDTDTPVITLGEPTDDFWTVEQVDGEFVVRGKKIEKFARRTNFAEFQNVNRLRDIMKKMGISHELIRQGAQGDSLIRIGDSQFTLVEQ